MIILAIVATIALLILFGGTVYLLVSFLAFDLPNAKNWKHEWPPISDDEFIARCRPGVDRDVALRVRRIVSEQLGVPYEQIYPEQNFVNDLGCC